jgi:hypothetical protein
MPTRYIGLVAARLTPPPTQRRAGRLRVRPARIGALGDEGAWISLSTERGPQVIGSLVCHREIKNTPNQ